MKYRDIVSYESRRLFSGAIDLDNFISQPQKAEEIALSYMFHGKTNHVGEANGHTLTDSISFLSFIIDALKSESPEMILGIAGYGVGKSHFALTIAELLASKNISMQEKLLSNIRLIDSVSEASIREVLNRDNRRYLVIPINGMRDSNLKDLFFSIVKKVLVKDGVDASCLDEFDPRFTALKEVVLNYKGTELVNSILNDEGLSRHSFEAAMDSLDNDVYSAVCRRIKENGIKYFEPAAIGDLKDIVATVANSLCGNDKPYRAMLIIFDEFGKYMAFAAGNETVAGEGCLQHLFEGIQTNSGSEGHVVLLGLSQLDLKEYQMSSGDISFANIMKRYVSRFDSAKRYYLSACFETLVANLIHIKDVSYRNSEDSQEIDRIYSTLTSSFKSVGKSNVWADKTTFTNVIYRGCWPLSPYLMWTLSYITSVNNLLQQRSGFNLLSVLFEEKIMNNDIVEGSNRISATELLDSGLLTEFLDSERAFSTSNPIASEYSFLLQKYANLSEDEKTVLKAIVLSHKLRVSCSNKNATNSLLAELSGLSLSKVNQSLKNLSGIYNAVDFNMAMGLYEIHSDTVSVTEFERKIEKFAKEYTLSHTRVELYNEVGSYFNTIPELTAIRDYFFKPINCDFAEEHDISTSEWKYTSQVIIGYEYLAGVERIVNSPDLYKVFGYDEAKGRVIYTIIPKDVSLSKVKVEIEEVLKNKTQEMNRIPPVMIFLISDKGDEIFNAIIKYRTLNHLPQNDQDKYFTLINKQKESLCKVVNDSIERQYNDNNYVYVYPEGISKKPLKIAGDDIFEEIYSQVIPFFIDGTNWMSAVTSINKMFSKGNPTWSDVLNSSDSAFINRCKYLFEKLWDDVDEKKGYFRKNPKQETISSIFDKWDTIVTAGAGLDIYQEYSLLRQPPYGMNSTAATLLVIVYLGLRTLEFDFYMSGNQISLLNLVQQKGSLAVRSQVLSESVWSKITIRKSIKDDAKWISLLNRWANEKDLLTLITLQKEAEQLQAQNVSIPTFLLSQFSDCSMHSETAKALYSKWLESKETLRSDIDSDLAKGRIGKPLKTYCDYLSAYKYSLGKCANQRPSITVSESISDEEDAYRKTVESYFENSIEEWLTEHPLSYLDNKEKYTEGLKKYQAFKANLETAGLIDEAQDIQIIIDETGEKRKVFLSYSSILSKTRDKKKSIDKIISNGLFTTSQVEASIGQLRELLQDIGTFPVDKLPLIAPYSFDEIKKDINLAIASVNDISKKKDEEFSNLMNSEIKTIGDIKNVYKTANSLIEFYKGSDENLEDAKLMSQESLLLREAYMKINDSVLSIAKIEAVAEAEKKRISDIMDGNSIFDDDEIIDTFLSDRKKVIEADSISWVQGQEMALERCKNTQDVNRVIFALDSPPLYSAGLIKVQTETIRSKAHALISSMKLDYMKGLFEELTAKERKEFTDWCNKKS